MFTPGTMRREWIEDRPYKGLSLLERAGLVLKVNSLTFENNLCVVLENLMADQVVNLSVLLGPPSECDHGPEVEAKAACGLRKDAHMFRVLALVVDAAADVIDPKAVEP